MTRVLKWFGIAIGGVVLIVVLILSGLYITGRSRLDKVYSIPPETVAVPTDAEAIRRGGHWVSVHCAGCHGENLAGTVIFDDPALGRIPAGNLTSGKGGIDGTYGVEDWVRAMRHGVGRDGKSFLIMPSTGYYWLSDDDLGAMIAYVKQAPAVDNNLGRRSITPLANVLFVAGAFGNALVAEVIDHNGPRSTTPRPGVTAEYGEYLVKTGDCAACHGATLSGGQPSEPGSPWAPDLTSGGTMRDWSEADFVQVFRTRDTRWMPYKWIGRMTDDELRAMWLYLKSLPPKDSKG